MAKTRPPYPPEFRRQMVELVRAGRSPEELARSSNRRHSRSGTGWRRLSVTRAGGDDGLTDSEREELSRLRRENRQLTAGAGDPLKSRGLVRSGDEHDPTEGFRFVSEHQADYPIATHVPAAGCLPQRLLCVDEAAAVAACRDGCGADRRDPCGACGLARHLRRAAHSCRACGQAASASAASASRG